MNVCADRLPAGLVDDAGTLIYGIGNAGRCDDGLGWAVIDRLEQCAPRAALRRTYQLNLEDADLITGYPRVVFVDATKDSAVESFSVSRPQPRMDLSFTSHALSVPAVLATALRCFDRVPETYVLGIRGYRWDLREGLTPRARRNLERAVAALAG
ncbi:hydrogenase maturation protease [Mycolicibacterium sp.]|uniref:hydrogenase maturation protease n=1 Tax=Mycolicibacterium sp. TaxID=2320850 RepID=UPI003D126048